MNRLIPTLVVLCGAATAETISTSSNHLPICRDDDLGSCVFQNGGTYLSFCGDPTFGDYFFEPLPENWCHSSLLDTDICCGGGQNCCQVKWKLIISICVGVSVAITLLCCCVSCFCSIFCGSNKTIKKTTKKIIRYEDYQNNIHPQYTDREPDQLMYYNPNARVVALPDGSFLYPDSSILYPDGSIQYPDGHMEYADGSPRYPSAQIA